MKIACIVNPLHGKARIVRTRLLHHCRALGFDAPLFYETTAQETGASQARSAIEHGASLLIVSGGDGTIRNISNSMADSLIPIGIIPTGTANIFHLNAVGRDRNVDRAIRTALLGEDTPVDTGLVQLSLADGTSHSQRFLVVVGIGRDAMTVDAVTVGWKQRTGSLAYFAAGFRHLPGAHLPMHVTSDGAQPLSVATWSTLIANCGNVPGRISVVPGARINDGELNLLMVAPQSLSAWLPIAWHGLRRSHDPLRTIPGLTASTAKHVTVIPDHPMPVQVDGDVWRSVIRIETTIQPASIVVRCPPKRPGILASGDTMKS